MRDCKAVSVPRRNMSGNQANTSQGILPNRIIIGIVDADAWYAECTFSKDPFDFKNYDITKIGLTVNEEHFSDRPIIVVGIRPILHCRQSVSVVL